MQSTEVNMNKFASAIFVNKSNLKLANLADANPFVPVNVPRHIRILIKSGPFFKWISSQNLRSSRGGL